MTSPVFDLSGAVLTLVGPVAVLMPSYIPFAWPQSAASWILAHGLHASTSWHSGGWFAGPCSQLLEGRHMCLGKGSAREPKSVFSWPP